MTDEYIRRGDALKGIELFQCGWVEIEAVQSDYIERLPAADVAPVVHEKWLLDRWPRWPHRECSRCKIMIPRTKEVADQYWQYCPNCGAKMDGGFDDGKRCD